MRMYRHMSESDFCAREIIGSQNHRMVWVGRDL